MSNRTAYVIQHLLFEDIGLLEPLLSEQGYDIATIEAGIGDIPGDEDLGHNDLLIVLGGPIGVSDIAQYPFLDDEIALLRGWIARGGATLGICLGAQLIAAALGAPVTATGRKEIGYMPLSLTDAGSDSVLAPLADQPVLHWHGDQFDIPSGASHLASTDEFPHQAFAWKNRVLGLQFHIEADHRDIERWLIGHAGELAAAKIDPRRIREDAAIHGPALAERAVQVLGAWLDDL